MWSFESVFNIDVRKEAVSFTPKQAMTECEKQPRNTVKRDSIDAHIRKRSNLFHNKTKNEKKNTVCPFSNIMKASLDISQGAIAQ